MLVQCMYLKKIGKVFTSKFVGTGPSSYRKERIYRAAVSKRLRNTGLKQGVEDRKAAVTTYRIVPTGIFRLPGLRVFPCFFLNCKSNVRV